MLTDIQKKAIKELVSNKEENIVIISHRNPDGDAMGSALGLHNVLKSRGINSHVLLPNDFADFLRWMPGAEDITVFMSQPEKGAEILSKATLIVGVDFNDISRIKEFKNEYEQLEVRKILIDHHPDPSLKVDVLISETKVSSSAELVYQCLKDSASDNILTPDAATCFYTGIMTDTGNFSHNSSRPETYHIVADLMAKGINKDAIFDKVYNNYTYHRMRLMGYCLNKKMVHLPEYRMAYIWLTSEEQDKFNFVAGDTEGFVNLPLSIKGVVFSALFIEKSDRIKISLRSKRNLAINKIVSEHFRGGGHVNAAGGESYLSMQKTIKKFLKILPDYKDEIRKA